MEQSVTGAVMASLHLEIEKRLQIQGYRRTRLEQRRDSFGHLYAVYETPERVIRFIWDGRDGTVMLRMYGRRNWGQKLMKALIGGTAGDERLLREAVVGRQDAATLSETELLERLTKLLDKE